MANKLKQIKVTIKGEDLDEILQGLNVVIAELQAGNVEGKDELNTVGFYKFTTEGL